MEFNHEADTYWNAINVTKKTMTDLADKTSTLALEFVEKFDKESELTEAVMHTMSYNDLLIIATKYIKSKVIEAQKESLKSLSDELLNMLKNKEDEK